MTSNISRYPNDNDHPIMFITLIQYIPLRPQTSLTSSLVLATALNLTLLSIHFNLSKTKTRSSSLTTSHRARSKGKVLIV